VIGHWTTKDFEKKEAMLEFTEIHRPRRHPISYLIKLSTFLYTFHKVMATTKANVILKDAKDWLEWIGEHWH